MELAAHSQDGERYGIFHHAFENIATIARCVSPVHLGQSRPRKPTHPTLHKGFNFNLKSHL